MSGTTSRPWGVFSPNSTSLLREMTELNPEESLNPDGMISQRGKGAGPAVDGQAGIILRCLRDHQVSPDDAFLKRNWPNIKKALEWLIAQDGIGDGHAQEEPGTTRSTPSGLARWHGSAACIWRPCGPARRWPPIWAMTNSPRSAARSPRPGAKSMVERMWNGEYFIQVADPNHKAKVGSYDGCEIDQVLGQSWAYQVGLGEVMPRKQTRIALQSLWKYNFTPDVGPFRKAFPAGRWYALAGEAGTLMCSWPKGDAKRVKADFDYYFNECMNGFEHQVAGHMIWENMLTEGFAIERAIHDRYDAVAAQPVERNRVRRPLCAVDGELWRVHCRLRLRVSRAEGPHRHSRRA